MKTIFDYIAIVGAYCCNCIFQPYCHVDRIRCNGRIMADIYVNYKQTNAAAELVDKISKKIGRRLE